MTLNRILQDRGYMFIGYVDKTPDDEHYHLLHRTLRKFAEQGEIAAAVIVDGNTALRGSKWELFKPKYFAYVLPHNNIREKPRTVMVTPRLIHQETLVMTNKIPTFVL